MTAQNSLSPTYRRAPADTVMHSADTEPDRFVEVPLSLLGRFMRANKQESPCKLIDISVGGCRMLSPVLVARDEKIIVYFDQLGGLEGAVTAYFDGGFAMSFTSSLHKREKLAAQLTYLLNREELDPTDERRHERVALVSKFSSLRLSNGDILQVRVIDVSMSGASIGIEPRPDIGTEVTLGKLRAKVVRHHSEGIGVQFLDIQAPDAVRRYFG